jgi:hypothetical protein
MVRKITIEKRVDDVGRNAGPYIIFISFIGPPQASHFIILLFIIVGPIFIWWQVGHIVIAISAIDKLNSPPIWQDP